MAGMTDDEFLGNSTPQQTNGGMSDEEFLKGESKPKEKYGTLESGLAGLESGVTAGWADEIRAAGKASGLPDAIRKYVPGSTVSAPLIGAARLAYEHLTGQPGEASRVYDETVKAHRERSKDMQEEHPWAYGAGDLAGSILPMAAFPMEGAATIPAKMAQAAKAGAAYGAVSGAGEGEGLKDSVIGAGVGAVTGGAGGAAAVPVGEAIHAAGKFVGAPVVNTIKGLINPEKEAERRLAGSLVADGPQVASGKAQGLTPQDWAQSYANGEPVMLGDMGGARTRALLRSATNNSPEGRDIAENAIANRFFTQADRAGSTIRGLVDGGANSAKTKAQLQAEYDAERNIAYKTAYDAGDRPINSPELERLMGSKAVGSAVKDAIENGQDRLIAQGQSGAFRTPYTVTADGRVVKNPGTSGIPTYPNLAFWDQTYRSLRDSADQAFRAGRNNEGSALKAMSDSMRSELDRLVPSYANARGVASTYFGGVNAQEAGQKAVTSNAPIEKLRQAIAKMGPAEKEMFQEAYADTWASNIGKAPRNRDLTNRADLANSINADKKLSVVFGQQKADRVAALAEREKIYDASRKALGNSTTVRQMIEGGLAGGVLGAMVDGGHGGFWSASGALAGAGSMTHHAPRALMKTATGYVNRNVAKHVAELYTSDDPMKVQRGLAMIASNKALRDGMAAIRGKLEAAIGASTASDQANKQRLQLTVGPNQDKVPQRAEGGPVLADGDDDLYSKNGTFMYHPKDNEDRNEFIKGFRNEESSIAPAFAAARDVDAFPVLKPGKELGELSSEPSTNIEDRRYQFGPPTPVIHTGDIRAIQSQNVGSKLAKDLMGEPKHSSVAHKESGGEVDSRDAEVLHAIDKHQPDVNPDLAKKRALGGRIDTEEEDKPSFEISTAPSKDEDNASFAQDARNTAAAHMKQSVKPDLGRGWMGTVDDYIRAKSNGKATGGRVTSANAARTRKESHYNATRGNQKHHCGPVKEWPENSCLHYKTGNKCNIVGGFIANRGGCDWFRNIKNRADGGAINHNPSEAQKEAGNYKKGHVNVHGLNISIENTKGSTRSGTDKDGKPWSVKLPYSYGYIRGTTGADKDHIDVIMGLHKASKKIFVVDQHDADSGKFDEHKVGVGWGNLNQFRNAYVNGFSDGRGKDRMRHITEMNIVQFKDWLKNCNTREPIKKAA